MGTIAERPTKMLIDSGASVTLINSTLFHQLPYYIQQNARYPSSKFEIHLADKSCLQIQKTLFLPITIANHTREHIVHVVPKLWRPCIIGTPYPAGRVGADCRTLVQAMEGNRSKLAAAMHDLGLLRQNYGDNLFSVKNRNQSADL
jgi:predicted HD phosphohydrolase